MCKVKNITTEDGQVYDIGGEYEFSYDGETWRRGIFESIKKNPDGYLFQTKDYNNTSIRHIPKPEPKFKVGEMVSHISSGGCFEIYTSLYIEELRVWIYTKKGSLSPYLEDKLELYTPPDMIEAPDEIIVGSVTYKRSEVA